MAVCFVVENLLPAGTELWIRQLVTHLDRRRIKPFICLTDGTLGTESSWTELDCELLQLGLANLKSPRLPHQARRLARFLREHHVDIVQVHHADPTYLAVPVARFVGVKRIVQTKYDVGYWLHGFDLWLHRQLRRWIDVTVANCEACRQAALRQEYAPEDSVVVIANGIATDALLTLPPIDPRTMEQRVHIGMLANLRPVKAPQNLVEVAARLKVNDRLRFEFAGEGELYDPLREQIRRHDLQDRVTLHGHVADTPRFLRGIDISVLCSKSEGLPHALLESMAAGRAVVATNVGGNSELIDHERNGLLIPVDDLDALQAAILRLSKDPEMAVRLGRAAREDVGQHYGLDAMTRRFEAFYESLCTSASTATLDAPREHAPRLQPPC